MHQAHLLSLSGHFNPLSLPPAQLAPPAIAAVIERYNGLKNERNEAVRRRKDLNEKSQDKNADEKDAQAAADGRPTTHRAKLANDREAARLAVAGIEVKLDRCLGDLLDALTDERDTWAQTLANERDEARRNVAEALAVVEAEGQRIDASERVASWLSGFPQKVKWGESQPMSPEMALPLSTLQRYVQGDITLDEIMLRPPAAA